MFFAGSACRAFADQKLLLGKQLVSAGTIANSVIAGGTWH